MGGIWRYFGEPNGSLVTLEILKKGGPKKTVQKRFQKGVADHAGRNRVRGVQPLKSREVKSREAETEKLRTQIRHALRARGTVADIYIYIYIYVNFILFILSASRIPPGRLRKSKGFGRQVV